MTYYYFIYGRINGQYDVMYIFIFYLLILFFNIPLIPVFTNPDSSVSQI